MTLPPIPKNWTREDLAREAERHERLARQYEVSDPGVAAQQRRLAEQCREALGKLGPTPY